MKTTIDLDEEKLKRVMKLTGVKTRKQAIDLALDEIERAIKINKLFARKPLTRKELKNAVDPKYDLMALRKMEKPDYQ